MMHYLQPACRACGEVGLTAIAAAGAKPAADRLLGAERPYQRRFKHTVGLVLCPNCSLVQRVDTSAVSVARATVSPAVACDVDLAGRIIKSHHLTPRSLVLGVCGASAVEAALLDVYRRADIPVLAIAPPDVAVGRDSQVPTLRVRFSGAVAERLLACGQPADVVHVPQLLATAANLSEVVAGVWTMLAPGGIAVFDVPYLRHTLDSAQAARDTTAHLNYFSLSALDRLLLANRLHATGAEILPGQGLLRVWAGRPRSVAQSAKRIIADEQAWGVDRVATYREWAQTVESLRSQSPIFAPGDLASPTSHAPSAV